MKNFLIKSFFVVSFFYLFSCQSGYSPKAVVNSFLKAFEQKKFDEAKKYCTPETIKLVEIAESLSKMSTARVEYAGKKYEVLSQEIKGEKAIVKFKEKGSDEIQSMMLKKVNDQWLVAISKEDIMAKENTDKFNVEEKENGINDSINAN